MSRAMPASVAMNDACIRHRLFLVDLGVNYFYRSSALSGLSSRQVFASRRAIPFRLQGKCLCFLRLDLRALQALEMLGGSGPGPCLMFLC